MRGGAIESNAAQQAARENAYLDKVTELRKSGLSGEEARAQADEWIKTQAVLHNPDQLAGRNPTKVDGLGDKGINSSIGAQWKYRIDDGDAQIQKMSEQLFKDFIIENKADEALCNKYEGTLPNDLMDLWKRYGFGNFMGDI